MCADNPGHCGGTGGCDGATGEIAVGYVQQHGANLNQIDNVVDWNNPQKWRLTGKEGTDGNKHPACEALQRQATLRVGHYETLPKNQQWPLKLALVNQGPVIVSLNADPLFDYSSGIIDDQSPKGGCKQDTVVSHAVILIGYGKDSIIADKAKEDKDNMLYSNWNGEYWRIRNSWGQSWGEQGFTRIFRHGDGQNMPYCGMDTDPQKGVGCDPKLKPGEPTEIPVCGVCGVLSDSVIPYGVRGTKQDDTDGDSGNDDAQEMVVALEATRQAEMHGVDANIDAGEMASLLAVQGGVRAINRHIHSKQQRQDLLAAKATKPL